MYFPNAYGLHFLTSYPVLWTAPVKYASSSFVIALFPCAGFVITGEKCFSIWIIISCCLAGGESANPRNVKNWWWCVKSRF